MYSRRRSSRCETEWLDHSFSNVVHFEVIGQGLFTVHEKAALISFHGFSSIFTSLRVAFSILPSSQIRNLIFYFPLLEDLTVVAYFGISTGSSGDSSGLSIVIHPSNSPRFTGSLDLLMRRGMKHIVHQLLSLPGDIRFRKLTVTWLHEDDLSLTTALVERCSDTLESLNVTCEPCGAFILHPRPRR